VTPEGNEITGYDQPGELLVKSPAVVLGYLNNDRANRETFQDGYMRTGDEAVIRKSPSGNEHIFIVDRIKELIKVKVSIKASSPADTHSQHTGPPSCTCRVGSASFDAPGSQ
jgi:acyl-CoA synthetase (AMP-forming)/AMP-acid ligase II